VFIVVSVYFIVDSVRKLLDTPCETVHLHKFILRARLRKSPNETLQKNKSETFERLWNDL